MQCAFYIYIIEARKVYVVVCRRIKRGFFFRNFPKVIKFNAVIKKTLRLLGRGNGRITFHLARAINNLLRTENNVIMLIYIFELIEF